MKKIDDHSKSMSYTVSKTTHPTTARLPVAALAFTPCAMLSTLYNKLYWKRGEDAVDDDIEGSNRKLTVRAYPDGFIPARSSILSSEEKRKIIDRMDERDCPCHLKDTGIKSKILIKELNRYLWLVAQSPDTGFPLHPMILDAWKAFASKKKMYEKYCVSSFGLKFNSYDTEIGNDESEHYRIMNTDLENAGIFSMLLVKSIEVFGPYPFKLWYGTLSTEDEHASDIGTSDEDDAEHNDS